MKIFELNAGRGHHVLLMVAVIFVADYSTGIAAAQVATNNTGSTDDFLTETITMDSTTVRASSAGSSDSALVLIQQADEATNVKPDDVKEQFQRFISAYDIDLGGVSVEFDVGKGK